MLIPESCKAIEQKLFNSISGSFIIFSYGKILNPMLHCAQLKQPKLFYDAF